MFKCSSTVESSFLQLLKQARAAVNSRSNPTKIFKYKAECTTDKLNCCNL